MKRKDEILKMKTLLSKYGIINCSQILQASPMLSLFSFAGRCGAAVSRLA
jgi:hypothetical protein